MSQIVYLVARDDRDGCGAGDDVVLKAFSSEAKAEAFRAETHRKAVIDFLVIQRLHRAMDQWIRENPRPAFVMHDVRRSGTLAPESKAALDVHIAALTAHREATEASIRAEYGEDFVIESDPEGFEIRVYFWRIEVEE